MTSEEQQSSGLATLIRTLRRRAVLIAICTVLVPGAALALSLAQEKQYSTTASLLFRDPQFDQKLFGSTVFAPSTDPAREAATNVKLVSLEVVAARTSRALHGALSPNEIGNRVSVASAGHSDVASITATDHDPAFAARLANTFAQHIIAVPRDPHRPN